ncbi:MAG: signal peptidase I [Actinomycetota bacterium]|nr:signal peptidase I [Actinomycetota bacterium]
MTDETSSGHFQSESSASDDEIGDELDILGSAEGGDGFANDLPAAPSPRFRARHLHGQEGGDAVGGERSVAASDLVDSYIAPPPPVGSVAPRPRRSDRHLGKRRGKPRRKAPWWELPLLIAVAIAIAVLVKTFVVQPFYIPSESMEKTLHGCSTCQGDRILVNKPIYDLRDPHPGDIVVFHAPPGWDEEPASKPPSNPIIRTIRGFGQLVGFVPPDGLVLVKRVIAVGGQTVKGVVTDGGTKDQVMVSDSGPSGPWRTLNEPYVYLDRPDSTGTFGPVTVPKGRLWVMGDHRNDSADSRFHCPGTAPGGAACSPTTSTVPIGDVIGKATVIAWPPSRWRTLGTPSTFTSVAGGALPASMAVLGAVPLWISRRRRRSPARSRSATVRPGDDAPDA